jgi:hypothetical protein
MRKYLEEMRGMLAKRRPTTNMLLNKEFALVILCTRHWNG